MKEGKSQIMDKTRIISSKQTMTTKTSRKGHQARRIKIKIIRMILIINIFHQLPILSPT